MTENKPHKATHLEGEEAITLHGSRLVYEYWSNATNHKTDLEREDLLVGLKLE